MENPIDVEEYRDHGFINDPQAVCATPMDVPLSNFDYETDIVKCGAKQIMSFGIFAILVLAFIPHKML